jgi:hypothetical protein
MAIEAGGKFEPGEKESCVETILLAIAPRTAAYLNTLLDKNKIKHKALFFILPQPCKKIK